MSGFWRVRNSSISLDRPLIMGVVNATPDSFSDGGLLPTVDAAVAHGLALAAAGADLIDVGGESTRPGAREVSAEGELQRVVPVIRRLAEAGLRVSIDTMKAAVARAGLEAGAVVVNDVSGMADPAMRAVAAEFGAGVVVMHMQGTPRTMQDDPRYDDVVAEVRDFLQERCRVLEHDGVDPRSIVVDPGIGFGKTIDHNLTLLNRLGELRTLGYPILVGASRKRFLGVLTGRSAPQDRDFPSAVAAAGAILRGADLIRVHDVALSLEAARIGWAIVRETGTPWGPAVAEGVAKG